MLCFRLSAEIQPALPLAEAVMRVNQGEPSSGLYVADPGTFSGVPNSPFAYWVGPRVRLLFRVMEPLSREGIVLRQGLATADDFRFTRAAWELEGLVDAPDRKWKPYAKGGASASYYADIGFYVNWSMGGSEIKSLKNANGGFRSNAWMLGDAERSCFYHQGFTWPRRPSSAGTFKVLPKGAIFSVNGPSGFANDEDLLVAITGIGNTSIFNFLVKMLSSRGGEGSTQTLTYEVGYVGHVPLPAMEGKVKGTLIDLTLNAWSQKRRTDTATLTSHAFYAPALAPGRNPQPTR